MSEIQLAIQDQYMAAFLEFIKTLPYIEIQQVLPTSKLSKPKKTKVAQMLEQIPQDAPIRKVIRPIRKSKSLDEMAKAQNYRGTNMENLKKIALAMDLQEPIEELLAQLTP
ncbi:MAG: hypothetical protein RLZZ628_4475 [Bacteroidota bacterium]|jgi:hypothetical protein